MPTISLRYDIKSLIERYAPIQFANKGRPSTSNGIQEWHSNCPWCPGSEDSFIMRPELGDYSHAIRTGGCGRHGDCLDFLKDYCNMSHREACEVLDIEVNGDFIASPPSQIVQNGKEDPPNKLWQESGKNLVERAARYLWTPAGKEMLDYLHARGLGDEIIKKKKLGYVPKLANGRYYEDSLENWGLDPETCKKDKVRVPNGILIPWFEGSTLWRLTLKRPNPPEGQSDYGQVVGSGDGLFNVSSIQYGEPVMMVEAEFCAMAVEQEAGDLITCVATGSTTRARTNLWVAEVRLASYALQSFDEDEKGDTGTEYWFGSLEKCMRWSPLAAKDPNDILLKKFFPGSSPVTLREWVEAGIQAASVEFGLAPLLPAADCHPIAPIHLARGSLLQSRNHLPLWTEQEKQDFKSAFAHVQVVGPEVDLNAQPLQEYVKSHLVPGICLNKNCPCQEVWGKWVLERALEKGRAPKKKNSQ